MVFLSLVQFGYLDVVDAAFFLEELEQVSSLTWLSKVDRCPGSEKSSLRLEFGMSLLESVELPICRTARKTIERSGATALVLGMSQSGPLH
jgi:hypothetical protein